MALFNTRYHIPFVGEGEKAHSVDLRGGTLVAQIMGHLFNPKSVEFNRMYFKFQQIIAYH